MAAPKSVNREAQPLWRKLVGLVISAVLIGIGCWIVVGQISNGHFFHGYLSWLGPIMISQA